MYDFIRGCFIIACRRRRVYRGYEYALTKEVEACRKKIAEDSTMLENLRYDEYIEAYAREHYNLQRKNETVYILKD